MKTNVEILLTLLALAGVFSALPNNLSKPATAGIRVEKTIMIADGSDPMPLCRTKRICGN